MFFLYLIQKNELKSKNIYKIGLLKSIEKIDKNHKIILLIKDENNLINLKNLIDSMNTKFEKYNNKNYFIGNENEMIYFVSQYVKNLYITKSNNLYNKNDYDIIKKIISLNVNDSMKYEQLSRLCNKKIEVRNIIFDSNLSNDEKYQSISNILRNPIFANIDNLENVSKLDKSKNLKISNINLNNFGYENLNFITKDNIYESIKECSFIELLNRYINFLHFDNNHPENHNIKYTENIISIYDNFEWKTCEINKVLINTIKNIYIIIFINTMEHSCDDLLYSKGLLTLKKINILLNMEN
jgi:hypothetical protein